MIKQRKVKKLCELPEICRKCPQRKKDKRVNCEKFQGRPCYLITNNSGRVCKTYANIEKKNPLNVSSLDAS